MNSTEKSRERAPEAVVPSESDDAATNDWGIDKVAGSDCVLAMYGVICTVGITGNLLVCIVLLRVPSLRSNTSHFLINLSIVDLLVCILVVPYKIVPPLIKSSPSLPPTVPRQMRSVFWGQAWCWLYISQYPFWVCVLASTYSLVTVNVERFVAIVYPHRYKRIFGSGRNKLAIIACCWILVALMKTYILFLYSYSGESQSECRFLGWPSSGAQAAMGVFTFGFNLLMPFTLMILMQWKVVSTLKKQVRNLTRNSDALRMNHADRCEMWQLRARQTLVRTLVAFALSFFVCWSPNSVMFLVFNLGGKFSFATPEYHTSVILAVCNSCVNPVIYALTNQAFRRGIRQAFCWSNRPRRVADHGGSVTLSVSMELTNRSAAS